jgi:hypothetical protein
MFEIKAGSEMDKALTEIEQMIYYIRNCAEFEADTSEAIENIKKATVRFDEALEVELNG